MSTQTEPQTIDINKMLYEQPAAPKPPPSPRRLQQPQQQQPENVPEVKSSFKKDRNHLGTDTADVAVW